MEAGAKFEQGDRYPCPCCGEYGCKECNGVGKVVIVKPLEIQGDIWETLAYCDMLEMHLPPITGGALDQDRWFIDAARFVRNEREIIKAELTKA